MRETCIHHRPKQPIVVVREDYMDLMGDSVAAAMLNLFEYMANAILDRDPDLDDVPLGEVSVQTIQDRLLGLSTDKQIRKRQSCLEKKGFISIHRSIGRTPQIFFHVSKVQKALNVLGCLTEDPGQITDPIPRSNNRGTPVKQPTEPRSNDHPSLYKKYLKEIEIEEGGTEKGIDRDLEPEKTESQEPGSQGSNYQKSIPVNSQSKPETTGRDQDLPPARSTNFFSSAASNEMQFTAKAWGFPQQPDMGFLEWLVKHHLPYLGYYEKRPKLGVRDAKEWVGRSRFSEERLMKVDLQWEAYQESLQQAAPKVAEGPPPPKPVVPIEERRRIAQEFRNASQRIMQNREHGKWAS